MTIYDISAKAGVSIATVSRVLNGSANVSDKTRKKVLDVIESCGYTPNAFARGLGLNTMKTIGILCADSSDPYLAKAVYHLERQLRANGYNSILCCSGYEHAAKESSLNLLLHQKADGIILTGSSYVYEEDADNQYIIRAARNTPIMLLNAALDADNVYSVVSDDSASMYAATGRMIASGIHRILYFYNSKSYSGLRKLSGYRTAMQEHALPSAETFYSGSHEDISAMVRHLKGLSDKGISFDGLIASDDVLALAGVKYAREQGLRIPSDLSVVGYNNSMLTRCCHPELSSIDNKLETLCEHLTGTLMGVLSGRDMPKRTVFSGDFISRGTTPF